MTIDNLTRLITRRSQSLFVEDIETHMREINSEIKGSRILVIGGAGSIGSATVEQILKYRPRSLHVVDQSENGLAELVRWLRSGVDGLTIDDFRTLPLDYGSQIMHQFIVEQRPYDVVLNFAALKHVRSEKDSYSLLQMIDTNVVKTARIFKWLGAQDGTSCFFSVSTDKAANPANMMGASKRLMEHVMFSDDIRPGKKFNTTSARFANVAFSDGSLLQSFLKRYEKRQPMALPRATRRYFISLEEAGQICLLSAFCGFDRLILIPKLDPSADMCTMEDAARMVLKYYGMKPRIYDDEHEARRRVATDCDHGYYPLFLTELNTSGEKPYEEFVGSEEIAVDIGFRHLMGVEYKSVAKGMISDIVNYLELVVSSNKDAVSKEHLVEAISKVLPEFKHIETGINLDQRM
ncbi:MAG: polysaccharide biosynthesis protein [Deltaproteobacteria bacterium]|nr:polysaccharide biosynthesis protein [Deltaproteobacteria bacterium]